MPSVSIATDDLIGKTQRLFDMDPDLLNDPWPVFAGLREFHPIVRMEPMVVVSRYEDIKEVMRDPATFSSVRAKGTREEMRRAEFSGDDLDKFLTLGEFESRNMTQQDDPNHARIRRFVNETFSAKNIAALRGQVEEIVQQLLDDIDARGLKEFDLVAEFAYQLPFRAVCKLLGVDDFDVEKLRTWQKAIRNGIGTMYANLDEAYDAVMNYRGYILNIIHKHRANPGTRTDLFAQLVSYDDDGTFLDDEDLTAIFIVMMTSGNANDLISNAIVALDANPDQRELLRCNPGLTRGAVEEFLRYCPSIYNLHRVATRDTELSGFEIRRGETVRLMIAGANHDPAKFESPEQLDITRNNARQHLGLGFGVHTCLGQWLARQEVELALAELLRRYPNLRVSQPVTYRQNFTIHGPDVLMVTV